MSIQETADFFGITKDTLRYYEHKGIIPPIPRNENGYRIYGNYELNMICLVLELKKLGLSLNKIAEFISLLINPSNGSLEKQRKILQDQIEITNDKIVKLEEVRKILEEKLEQFNNEFNRQFMVEALWKQYQK